MPLLVFLVLELKNMRIFSFFSSSCVIIALVSLQQIILIKGECTKWTF
jgi:hypothetical protein